MDKLNQNYPVRLYLHTERDIQELKKFAKTTYVEDTILSAAHDLKYARLLDGEIVKELEAPSEDMVKLLGCRVYDGRMTAGVMVWMEQLVKDALSRSIRKKVRENLESALDKGNENAVQEESIIEEANDRGIITTDEEIDAFNIIRAIASEAVDPSRLFMRDSKRYCAILFDDNNRRPLARLYLEGKIWRVGTFKSKVETRHEIEKLSDIFKLAPLIKDTLVEYI